MKKYCSVCGKELCKKNKSGFCVKHLPRSGKNNPFYGKKHSKDTIDKIKKKISQVSKEKWNNSEYRKKVINGMTGKKRSDEFKEKQRQNAIKQFKDNNQRKIRSDKMKESWAKGKIPLSDNYSINRSKKEEFIFNFLKRNGFKVERKTIHISDKYYFPDIIINDKIIIEFFGDYWHMNPLLFNHNDINPKTKKKSIDIWDHDKNRIYELESNGYCVYVIWEYDLKYKKEYILNQLITNIEVILKDEQT